MKLAIVIAALALLLSACTSSTSIKPEIYKTNISKKYPAIILMVNGGHLIDSGCYSGTCYRLEDRTPEFVLREFRKSNNFEKILINSEMTDWVIDVNLGWSKRYVEGSGNASLAATVLTLGMVPTQAKHEYEAYIRVLHNGQLVKEYEYTQIVDEVSSVFTNIQAADSDAAVLLISKFFKDIEYENPFLLNK